MDLPRGIDPELLVSQVRNTMPYLFDEECRSHDLQALPAAKIVLEQERTVASLSHVEYFKLCVSAHYLTCGTPVPTDVDNQIRLKLWHPQLPEDSALEMAAFILKTLQWNFQPLSQRWVFGAKESTCEQELLSGHNGEWFTLAAAAYCALGRYESAFAKALREQLCQAIALEVEREGEIFASLWKAQDGIGCLKASASIAHNLGDLDRVMEMWDLKVDDPLRMGFTQLGSRPFNSNGNLRYRGRLWTAGELYKSEIQGSSMAKENHRHFALRKPRALRQRPNFQIPTGPFFDEWGSQLVMELGGGATTHTEDLLEITRALWLGSERLPETVGYIRALRTFLEHAPELERQVMDWDSRRLLKSKRFKRGLSQSRETFEAEWNVAALQHLDDIPSRA